MKLACKSCDVLLLKYSGDVRSVKRFYCWFVHAILSSTVVDFKSTLNG